MYKTRKIEVETQSEIETIFTKDVEYESNTVCGEGIGCKEVKNYLRLLDFISQQNYAVICKWLNIIFLLNAICIHILTQIAMCAKSFQTRNLTSYNLVFGN